MFFILKNYYKLIIVYAVAPAARLRLLGASAAGAGLGSSFLPQPTMTAAATRPMAAARNQVRFLNSVIYIL
jgi:hypothetical protein